MRLPHLHQPRRGTTLLYFAVITFALMGMAALVIDIGLARLTQTQMQTAVDSAAKDGLRFRDDPTVDPAERDTKRREKAQKIVTWTFDDDLNESADNDRLGAGAIIDFSGGIPVGDGFNASQNFDLTTIRPYEPRLKSNPDNSDPGADMVAGKFVATGTGTESTDYTRDDFVPGDAANSAFLVRLRRSSRDYDVQSDTRSNPGPLPYLFARGSLLNTEAKGKGITVRGTAIADARFAVSAGKPYPDDDSTKNIPGAAPFVFFLSSWQNATLIPEGTAVQVEVINNTTLQINGTPIGYLVGEQVEVTDPPQPATVEKPRSIGMPLTQLTATLTAASLSDPAYVPIIPNDGSTIQNRVIGFGYVQVVRASITSTGFMMTKKSNQVAARNATAVFTTAPPVADFDLVIEKARQLPNPVLVPVVVR